MSAALRSVIFVSLVPGIALASEGLPIGKLHPAIVHFPIALLIVAAVLEGWAFVRRRSPSDTAMTCLLIGAVGAIAATYLGWELAEHEEEFHGELERILLIHRWGGVATAVVASLGAVTSLFARRGRLVGVYRGFVLLGAIAVGGSAHFGGLLVHGADYYDEFLGGAKKDRETKSESDVSVIPANFVLPPPATSQVQYGRDIHPIVEESCGRCHLGGKQKGDFRMDTREDYLRGGESGKPSIVVGESAKSHLIELISGANPKKVMPNKGKRLTEAQVGLFRAWIDQGFNWGNPTDEVHSSKIKKVGFELTRPALSSEPGLDNSVDRALSHYFQTHEVSWGNAVDDRTYARRVYLDLTGTVPPFEELKKFLASSDPQKRKELVKGLLDRRQEFSLHWLTFWSDALRNDYSGPGFLHGERTPITNWLYAAIYQNRPYDQFVTELVNPVKGSGGFIKGILWWKDGNVTITEDPAIQAAQNVGQLFMGVNVKCASCHSSFTDEWKLTDAYGLANVFVKGKPLETHECNNPTGKIVEARFLYPELGEIPKGRRSERQAALAGLLTSERNGRFARTMVNRMWRMFFGRGIVEPIDEMDVPPWSKELLDTLAADFIDSGYNLRSLIEIILTSRAYQLEAVPAMEKYPDNYVFRGPVVRRLSVEQLFDSAASAFHVAPNALSSDVERAIAVTLANPFMKESESGADRSKILFSSGILKGGDGSKSFDVDLRGVSSVWLVALKRFKVKTADQKLREKFDQVQKQDSGILPIGASSSQLQKDLESQRRKGKTSKAKELSYRAIWRAPTLIFGGEKVSLSKRAGGRAVYEERPLMGEEGAIEDPQSLPKLEFKERDILGQAFSAVRYYVGDKTGARLTGSVEVEAAPEDELHAVEFVIIADLPLRTVLLEATPTLLALGRPRREQIATWRNSVATTIQALEASGGDGIVDLLNRCAAHLSAGILGPKKDALNEVFRGLLGREPTEKERQGLAEFVPVTEGRFSEEQIKDLMWSVLSLPEFQLIT